MMKLKDFCNLYNYKMGTIYVSMSNNSGIAKFIDKDTNLIDDKAFKKHVEYTGSLQGIAQELYYPVRSLFKSNAELGRILSMATNRTSGTWQQWLSNDLFKHRSQKGYIFRIPKVTEEFIFVASYICIEAEKHNKLNLKDYI